MPRLDRRSFMSTETLTTRPKSSYYRQIGHDDKRVRSISGPSDSRVATQGWLLLKRFTTLVTVRDAEKANVDIRLQTIEQCNGEKYYDKRSGKWVGEFVDGWIS